MGKLIFRYGCMNAGKSAHLLMTGYNFEENGRHVVYAKPAIDTRDEPTKITSRMGVSHECRLLNSFFDLKEILDSELKEGSILLIDEAQFLEESWVNFLAVVIANRPNVICICYGLRTDSSSHLFPGSKTLMELADKIEELKSVCECGRKAIINGRIDKNGNFYLPRKQVEIGAEDKYKSVCLKCWIEKVQIL